MDCFTHLRRSVPCLATILFLALCFAPQSGMADMRGKQLVDNLIAKAKDEGTLDTAFVSEAGPATQRIITAFKKRFGLENLEVNVAVGNQPRMFSQLRAKLSAGLPPAVDSLTGSDDNVSDAVGSGYLVPIEKWKILLAEINPLVRSGKVKPGDISPRFYEGTGFVWGNRAKAMIYNPKLISEKELPNSHLQLADLRYKGKYVVPPWIDEWLFGLLFYKDKAMWLETLDQIGKNARAVLHLTTALQRVILGDLTFMPGNSYHYYQAKHKDPQASVGVKYWPDYTGVSRIAYVVPKGSRHPAAATLWNLWMTTPESEAVWQPVSLYPNVSYGQSDYDKMTRQEIQKANSRVVSFYDNDETQKLLHWLADTKEGEAYRHNVVKAVTQRRQRKKR